MTTEIAVPTSAPPARTAVDLSVFVEEARQVHQIAQALSTTSFVPRAYQGKPDEITAAILMGRELNISPMSSLQMFDLIQGRPCMSANAMRGLAMSYGVQFQILEQSDLRVVMQAKAPGNDRWTSATWTIDRARKMGLTKKDNWQAMPEAMLTARCTSQLCREVAANVLIGLPYSAEEMADVDETRVTSSVPMEQPTPEAPQIRKVRRKTPVYEAPEEVELEQVEEMHQDPPITTETRKMLMAACNDIGKRSRDDRLEWMSEVLGHTILTTNQLTDDEGLEVIRVANTMRNATDEWPPVAATAQEMP